MSRIAHSRNKHSIGIPNGSVSSSKTTSHFFQSELQWKNKSIIKLADFQIKIPMMKKFNSLNVSNALSIIIFEAVRQKNIQNVK